MTKNLLATIKWDNITSHNAYLYGSTIRFVEDQVVFENALIASGKLMARWHSRTNYQKDRFSPSLPLLEPGGNYLLESVLSCQPEGRLYVKVDFFNRMGELLSFAILRKNKQEFTYPSDAFSYTISLMSGGCKSFIFTQFNLYRLDGNFLPKIKSFQQKSYEHAQLPHELQLVAPLIQDFKGKQ